MDRTYIVTCTDNDASTVTATTADMQHTFTDDDGILGDVQYACYVAVTYPDGSTSPKSNPAIITVTGGISKSSASCNIMYAQHLVHTTYCGILYYFALDCFKQGNAGS